MTDWFIPGAWLASISGKTLLYPCGGMDWAEPIDIFSNYVSDFIFSDINYPQGLKLTPATGNDFKLTGSLIEGDPKSTMERRRENEFWFRHLSPSVLVERYERHVDGRAITVKRRRGFGQYAIRDLPDRSLGVFMHRGDSPGEAGSNVFFLANKIRRHEPCSRLLEKIEAKFADQAIVLSDGSNSRLKFLRKYHNSPMLGPDAWAAMGGKRFLTANFSWECIGFAGRRYGPTLAWGLTRTTF